MELEVDELERNVAESQSSRQGLLPISQNECSTQQANIGASSLTPAQRTRMAHQKEMALAKYRERHRQPPQRHDKLAMAFSPFTQLPTTHAHNEPTVDIFNNTTAEAQMILQVRKYSQKYPFVPTSDHADSCFYQDRHSFTQAKSDRAGSCFYQERHSFTQAKPFYISGPCYPNIICQSGSTASLTQSNTIFDSGATASFTQPNLNRTDTNAGVTEGILHGVNNEASEKLCHQVKRACFRVLDWNCDTSKGVSFVDETELKRALSFNPRVDVPSLLETGEHEPKVVPEVVTFNPNITLLSDSGNLFTSVAHFPKWILRIPRADTALLQDFSPKDDCALDHHRLKREAQDDNNKRAYVDESTASDCAGGSQYCDVPPLEQDCHLAVSNFCSTGKQGLTRSPGGTFEAAEIYKPVLFSLSEEDGGIKVKGKCHQAGKGEGKGADIIELSDDDGSTGKAVVIELSDDDNSTVKADIIKLSRVDGASQEVTSSATLGNLYQAENRGFDDKTYHYTNSSVSKKEQDLADGHIKQHSLCYTNHELVRSTAGFVYYRMQGLEDGGRKSTSMYKSEPHDLEENEDDTFIPLTVLPSALSKQQQLVLRAAAAGKSIFLTGAAGTGKSFLLGFVIDILRRRLGQQSVFVAASTGLAACSLNGTTIHSFAGIGLGKEKPDLLASKVMGSREAMNRWRNARALIIDEVSMIDGELFDKLDHVAKVVRAELLRDELLNKSFGGIQLIVTGDFFQLPPLKPVNQRKFFAFEADCWDKCFDVQIELKQIFRQHDGNFVGMLNEIRRGTHTPETLLPLQECIRALPENGSGIKATRLYPLKQDVNQENISTLRMLNRETVEFIALDEASSSYYRSMLQYMRAGNTLPLCIGAQVMLVKNLDTNSGLVNGARGVVVGFSSQSVLHDKDVDLKAVTAAVSPNGQWPIVQFVCDASQRVIGPHKDSIEDGGREVVSRVQVPLILAWALSVHKCQGMTLDRVKMDLSKAFGFGMVYVALSRVKNLNGLQLTGLNPSTIKAHPRVVQFYAKLDSKVLTC